MLQTIFSSSWFSALDGLISTKLNFACLSSFVLERMLPKAFVMPTHLQDKFGSIRKTLTYWWLWWTTTQFIFVYCSCFLICPIYGKIGSHHIQIKPHEIHQKNVRCSVQFSKNRLAKPPNGKWDRRIVLYIDTKLCTNYIHLISNVANLISDVAIYNLYVGGCSILLFIYL